MRRLLNFVFKMSRYSTHNRVIGFRRVTSWVLWFGVLWVEVEPQQPPKVSHMCLVVGLWFLGCHIPSPHSQNQTTTINSSEPHNSIISVVSTSSENKIRFFILIFRLDFMSFWQWSSILIFFMLNFGQIYFSIFLHIWPIRQIAHF